MPTTVGQIIVNEVLPEKYRNYERTLGANELEELLSDIIRNDPDSYKEVSAKLMRIGNRAAYEDGTTLRLSDIAPPIDRKGMYERLDKAEDMIRNDKSMTDEQKRDLLDNLYDKVYSETKKMAYEAALKSGNGFAMQVKSKARGNQDQLSAMMNTPGIYKDPSGRTVPLFIRHSFAEGLSPAEYWAGTYGARTGVVSTKFATAKAGELGKLLSSASVEQVITEDDCGTPNGMPTTVDDKDNVGAVLASPAGQYGAGTVITKQVLSDLKNDGIENISVRSPTTCNAKNGVCAHCAGIRENGRFPEVGYNLGLNSASALAERIAQSSLNCLVEGTLVRMADGTTRPIEHVEPGEYVMGSDMCGHVFPTRVVAVYDNGIQPCIRTKFIENGTHRDSNPGIVLESTSIHKLLGTRVVTGQLEERLNWVPRMLPVGQKSRCFYGYTVTSFDDSGLVEEPLAMLIGALLGDGCYTKSVNGVHLSCADDTEIEDLERTIQGYDLRIRRLKFHNGIYYRVSQSACRSGKNAVKNYLVKHGMYGKMAHEKTLPDVVRTWNNHSVGCLLGGLIATDGSVYSSDSNGKPGVSFVSTSRRLVEQFKELLGLRFGILGSAVCRTGRKGTYFRKYDQWQFTVTKPEEVLKLQESVTIPGVKRHRLAKLIADYKYSGKRCKIAFQRVSQEPIGDRHVYDLEVECPDHIFLLANGLIVSNTKHSGRKLEGTGYSGFDMLKRMATIPEVYKDKATVSEIDGRVEKIEKAPQGGEYVYVNDQKYYVPSGYKLLVKEGDEVESGDQLSDGVISPADAVRLKGIGEGRRYFTQRFTQAFRESGYKANRRNVEAIAKSLINNVVVEDQDAEGQMLPGDNVSYARWAWGYKPRTNSVQAAPSKAIGKYLEQPALHYTIGTRITKRVADELNKFKVQSVLYNDQPVGVRPEMRSIVETTGQTDDWMGRLATTYIGKRLIEDVQRGAESNSQGINPYPAVAKGTTLGQWGTPGHKDEEFHY